MARPISDATIDILPALAAGNIIVFDGVCVLCNGFVRFVLRHDRQARFSFLIAQTETGEALYRALELKSSDYDTVLVFVDGTFHEKLDAFCVVMGRLGWPWRALGALRVLPRGLKDWLYDRIARNRYAIFGRCDTCLVPDETLRERFLG